MLSKQSLEIIDYCIKKGLTKEAIWDKLYSKDAAPFVLMSLREPFEEAYASLYATHMAQGSASKKEYATKYRTTYDYLRCQNRT